MEILLSFKRPEMFKLFSHSDSPRNLEKKCLRKLLRKREELWAAESRFLTKDRLLHLMFPVRTQTKLQRIPRCFFFHLRPALFRIRIRSRSFGSPSFLYRILPVPTEYKLLYRSVLSALRASYCPLLFRHHCATHSPVLFIKHAISTLLIQQDETKWTKWLRLSVFF